MAVYCTRVRLPSSIDAPHCDQYISGPCTSFLSASGLPSLSSIALAVSHDAVRLVEILQTPAYTSIAAHSTRRTLSEEPCPLLRCCHSLDSTDRAVHDASTDWVPRALLLQSPLHRLALSDHTFFGRYQPPAHPFPPHTILPQSRETASIIHNGSDFPPRAPHQPGLSTPAELQPPALGLLQRRRIARRASVWRPLSYKHIESAGSCSCRRKAWLSIPVA